MAAKKTKAAKKKQTANARKEYGRITKVRHGALLNKISENVRNGKGADVTRAAVELGYSPSYARSGHFKKTDTFKKLFDRIFPDEKLAKGIEELSNQVKTEYLTFSKLMPDEEIYEHMTDAGLKVINIAHGEKSKMAFYVIPDGTVRAKALEMANKIKGTYAPEKVAFDDTITDAIVDRVNKIFS